MIIYIEEHTLNPMKHWLVKQYMYIRTVFLRHGATHLQPCMIQNSTAGQYMMNSLSMASYLRHGMIDLCV